MKRLKIGYITSTDAADKHSWSGTNHYIWKTLQKNVGDVELLGPAEPKLTLFFAKVFQAISIYIFRRRFDFYHSRIVSKAYGRIFSKKLKGKKYDVIFSPAGVAYTAYLKTDAPLVLVLDRTIGKAFDYHSVLSNLWGFSKTQSVETDKRAMEKASLVIFSSHWAADHAKHVYKIAESKIAVLPFGANMDQVPSEHEINYDFPAGEVQLLFPATNWEGKGGKFAYNCLAELLNKNINAKLTVIGCTPPKEFLHKKMEVHPFINKNEKAGMQLIDDIFKRSHFLILPTRFDCTPIVFCEASAYGLPSISADTGGVRGHITEGINGFLVPYEDEGEGYAKVILKLLENKTEYIHLRKTCRKNFEERLNWDSWSEDVKGLLEKTIR